MKTKAFLHVGLCTKILVFLFAILFSVSSCKKKEADVFIMNAKLNGKDINFQMHSLAIKGILKDSDGNDIRQTYQISGLGEIGFIMRAVDSTMTKRDFGLMDMEECMLWRKSVVLRCIDAHLKITQEEERMLTGEFSFVGVNDSENPDTLYISDGYFQMTMDVSVGHRTN